MRQIPALVRQAEGAPVVRQKVSVLVRKTSKCPGCPLSELGPKALGEACEVYSLCKSKARVDSVKKTFKSRQALDLILGENKGAWTRPKLQILPQAARVPKSHPERERWIANKGVSAEPKAQIVLICPVCQIVFGLPARSCKIGDLIPAESRLLAGVDQIV